MTIKELENLIELNFLKKEGNEFEKLVIQIYKIKYNGEIIPIKPAGQFGDFANDGYILNELLIQVYAPERVDYNNAIKKLEENFKRAKEHWKFKEWHFIINDKFKGVHPKIVQKISEIKNDDTKIKIVNSEDLRNEILSLYKSKPFEIYILFNQNIEIENFDDFENLSAVIDYISETSDIQNNPIGFYNFNKENFFQGKVEKIKINIKDKEFYDIFLKIIIQSRGIIPKYKKYFEENLLRTGKYIKDLYYNFKNDYNYSAEKSIQFLINNLINDLKNQKKIDKNGELALLIVIGYFFDICDIGEKPDGNGR
jgi:hypothetical protein